MSAPGLRVLPMVLCAGMLLSATGCGERGSGGSHGETAPDPVPAATPVAADAASAPEAGPPPAGEPDVIYVPTPEPVVDAMLNLARVREGELLYDLGSGDGRIPITAAKRFRARGVGIEIDPALIRKARANAEHEGVAALVTFRQADLFEADFSDADVVTLYLLDSLNEALRPRLLAELRPGTRIVSHRFGMGDWEPEQTVVIGQNTIHLWTVPAR